MSEDVKYPINESDPGQKPLLMSDQGPYGSVQISNSGIL